MADTQSKKRNTLTLVLFSVYLLVLSWLILFKLQFSFPVMEEGRVINLIPFMGSLDADGYLRFAEISNNILAFVPLGIYVCMLPGIWPFGKKVLAIAALSLGYEAAQFICVIGRADITDILANTSGGVIGIGIYALASRFLKGRTNTVITILAAVITALALLLIAVLLVNNRWVRIQ